MRVASSGRLIALGVTGSIAAYKAVELLRLLTAEGADVVVLLSPSATRFVGPLSFAALSRHPVETDVLDLLPDGRIGHIVVADIGRRDRRRAGDRALARRDGQRPRRRRRDRRGARDERAGRRRAGDGRRHVDAPGDRRANVARLRDAFGYTVVAPEVGPLASGQSGVGRLAELPRIVDAVVDGVARPARCAQPDAAARPPLAAGPPRDADLVGRRIVVTAGGTREPIDPVRFIGNRSTGRMGVALAEAALARGAAVTLIAARRRGAAAGRRGDRPGRDDRRARRGPARRDGRRRRRRRRARHGRRRRRLPAAPARPTGSSRAPTA